MNVRTDWEVWNKKNSSLLKKQHSEKDLIQFIHVMNIRTDWGGME
jgi:hypothetical protein